MDLGHPHGIEAERLPIGHQIEHLGIALGMGVAGIFGRFVEQAKLHDRSFPHVSHTAALRSSPDDRGASTPRDSFPCPSQTCQGYYSTSMEAEGLAFYPWPWTITSPLRHNSGGVVHSPRPVHSRRHYALTRNSRDHHWWGPRYGGGRSQIVCAGRRQDRKSVV